jgi:phage terminase small subunit
LVARQVWDRIAERIWREGRWSSVDLELLAVFAETLELYLKLQDDVITYGTLVQGRSLQERVRNPSLMGLAQARADLARYARQIPLMPPLTDADPEGEDVDRIIALMGTT